MDKNRIFGFIPSIPRWRPLTVGLFLVVLAASILVLFIPEEQGIGMLRCLLLNTSDNQNS